MIRKLFAIVLAACAFNAYAAVDANQANRADLETVKGIGPGLSGKILEARKAGNFKSWSDLVDRVGGIGPGNANRLSQAGLTVAGSGYDGATAPAKSGKSGKSASAMKSGEPAAAGEGVKPARAKKGDKPAA
jgi:competence protein ComEA